METYKLAPERVKDLFAFSEGMLLRRSSDGTYREVRALEGGKVVAMVEGEMIRGADIVWCLHYGNWPKYRLAKLSRDPYDLHISNLFPARLHHYRYRVSRGPNGGYVHPLSRIEWSDDAACYRNWEMAARDRYRHDLPTVEAIEARERAIREHTLSARPDLAPETAKENLLIVRKPRGGRPPRPAAPNGMMACWYAGAWLLVPQPLHPSDDLMVRCAAVKAGLKVAYDAAQQRTVVL